MKAMARILAVFLWAAACGLVATAAPARADRFDALRNDARLHNGLLVITIGRHIERRCPTIARRSLATNAFLLGLARHAMSLGFSRADVTAYVEDDAEQDRFIALARRYDHMRRVYREALPVLASKQKWETVLLDESRVDA